MNFFDYELSRTATATPPQSGGESSNTQEPSLNDEVTQVVGQLGRLWGGFRKQSQAALETARKDFSSVVAQAQKEIGKLTADPSTPATTDNAEASTSTSTQETGPSTSEKTETPKSPSADDETTPQPSSPTAASSNSSSFQFQSLLSRVQSSLPPNISATLERTIPAALKDPSAHAYADLTQLRTTLGAEFARVQGVTRTQAEEYVHRSEALLREAGAYLKDAVKVVPPEETVDDDTDVVFDGMGSGVVVIPSSLGSSSNRSAARGKGKGRETTAQAQQHFASSRAAAMLAQLKRDSEALKRDPLEDENAKEQFEEWIKAEVTSREGGIESSYWQDRVKEELGHSEDGEALRSTREVLVPSILDSNTFWTRYFFHVHQIEKDEEKRKALLQASGEEGTEEDFSWEDDEDESITPSESAGQSRFAAAPPNTISSNTSENVERGSRDTLQPGGNGNGGNATTPASYPESLVTSPSNTSPRESSDGYDVVSPASNTSAAKTKTKPAVAESKDVKDVKDVKPKEEKKDEDEADSDWE
ncbi:uncharacterized protein FOMMEDRAFT_108207 [Fomitiporia mediterranea MF3/22]|uniref:uncharacterized protein n=1 Tax=Fomitiporia mediterranea (strain MF3/22) TaxID=694068 RepID=UPI000440803C|nr:uncharacterized protein FOMMEDRAFT_108207 [Fomitiporia mediterranea MF3/22]EJD03086.1 hypothetical protein FOMMEDRAFT_108207 [Fomitiporia mediterranea MF3/22]